MSVAAKATGDLMLSIATKQVRVGERQRRYDFYMKRSSNFWMTRDVCAHLEEMGGDAVAQYALHCAGRDRTTRNGSREHERPLEGAPFSSRSAGHCRAHNLDCAGAS
jgi:hypothetical protein